MCCSVIRDNFAAIMMSIRSYADSIAIKAFPLRVEYTVPSTRGFVRSGARMGCGLAVYIRDGNDVVNALARCT